MHSLKASQSQGKVHINAQIQDKRDFARPACYMDGRADKAIWPQEDTMQCYLLSEGFYF